MKIRTGFVSNSSSCSFTITNLTDKTLRLEEFAREASEVVDYYNKIYCREASDEPSYPIEEVIESARKRGLKLHPGENEVVFGDEQGDLVGQVYDYGLRPGGQTERFSWKFKNWLR